MDETFENELLSEYNNNEIAQQLLQNFVLSMTFKIINDYFEENFEDPESAKLHLVDEWQREIASKFDIQWRSGLYLDKEKMKEKLSDDEIMEIEGNIIESMINGIDTATKYIKYRLGIQI